MTDDVAGWSLPDCGHLECAGQSGPCPALPGPDDCEGEK